MIEAIVQKKRILVLGMRTWGQFGNYLAATRLAHVLRDSMPETDVDLREAESFLPSLASIGAQIRDLTLESPDAAERSRRYLQLMEALKQRFPQGFEQDDPNALAFSDELEALAAHLREQRPDIVIGTKGVISRLLISALRMAGHRAHVVNHVTNEGLLRLPIHRVPDAMNFVGFDSARAYAEEQLGYPADSLRVVGPLIAEHQLKDFLLVADGEPARTPWRDAGDTSGNAKLIIFSNRGGQEYIELLRHLARHHARIDLVFVSYDDEALSQLASQLSECPAHWSYRSRLAQDEYFGYIHGAARAARSLLISKTGPNTTLEAAFFGIPVLSVDSGLPMEAWVPDLILEHGLGRSCRNMNELIATFDHWMTEDKLPSIKRNAMTFAENHLDQKKVIDRIAGELRALLDAPASAHEKNGVTIGVKASMSVKAPEKSTAVAVSDEFAAQWDSDHANVRKELIDALDRLGASPELLEYVGSMRLYMRVSFLLSQWIEDPIRRRRVSAAIGMHIISIKLLDDLVDADTSYDRIDLATSLQLSHIAIQALCELCENPHDILRVLVEDYEYISQGQIRTKRKPARSLSQWLEHAATYGSAFLACYGRLAAWAGRVPGAIDAASGFGRHFGLILTVSDDLRDYTRCGERDGNLGHLLLQGDVSPTEVVKLLDNERLAALQAAYSEKTAYDLGPVIETYVADVRDRMLPRLMALAPTAVIEDARS